MLCVVIFILAEALFLQIKDLPQKLVLQVSQLSNLINQVLCVKNLNCPLNDVITELVVNQLGKGRFLFFRLRQAKYLVYDTGYLFLVCLLQRLFYYIGGELVAGVLKNPPLNEL